jgi:hypothetical protein
MQDNTTPINPQDFAQSNSQYVPLDPTIYNDSTVNDLATDFAAQFNADHSINNYNTNSNNTSSPQFQSQNQSQNPGINSPSMNINSQLDSNISTKPSNLITPTEVGMTNSTKSFINNLESNYPSPTKNQDSKSTYQEYKQDVPLSNQQVISPIKETKKSFFRNIKIPINKEEFKDLPSSMHYWFIIGFVIAIILLILLIIGLISAFSGNSSSNNSNNSNSTQANTQNSSQVSTLASTNGRTIYDNNTGTDSENANNPNLNLGLDGKTNSDNTTTAGQPEAILVDATGKQLGRIDSKTGVLTDSLGKAIGKYNPKTGEMVDSSGKIAGKLDPQTGNFLDNNGKPLAKLVIKNQNDNTEDSKNPNSVSSKINQFIKSQLDSSGLNSDGTPKSNSNSDPTSGTTTNDPNAVDFSVFGVDGNAIGKINPATKELVDNNGKVAGKFDTATGQILDITGKAIAKVEDSTGRLLDATGKVIGRIEAAKKNPSSVNVGSATNSGLGGNPNTFDTGSIGSGGANKSPLTIPTSTLCQGECPLFNLKQGLNSPNDIVNLLLAIARLVGYFAVPLAVLVTVYIGIMTIFGVVKTPGAMMLNVAIGLALAILAITLVAYYTDFLTLTGFSF